MKGQRAGGDTMTQTQRTIHISLVNPAVTYHMSAQINGYSCSLLSHRYRSCSQSD
jgi:hypothetical protein